MEWSSKITAFGLMAGLSMPVFAETQAAELIQPELTIQVTLTDYVQLPLPTLDRAKRETARVLRDAGIQIEWHTGSTILPRMPRDPSEQRWLTAVELAVRTLPGSMVVRFKLPQTLLGYALPANDGGIGRIANVFYPRVLELARHRVVPADFDEAQAVFLGHALAHEIGHLLLGPDSHSKRGIMRCPWRKIDLEQAGNGNLLFTQQQAEQMRRKVVAGLRAASLVAETNLTVSRN